MRVVVQQHTGGTQAIVPNDYEGVIAAATRAIEKAQLQTATPFINRKGQNNAGSGVEAQELHQYYSPQPVIRFVWKKSPRQQRLFGGPSRGSSVSCRGAGNRKTGPLCQSRHQVSVKIGIIDVEGLPWRVEDGRQRYLNVFH